MKLPFLNNLSNIGKKSSAPKFTDELMISLDIGTEVLKTLMFRCSDMGVHILRSSRIFQQQHAMKSGVIKSIDTVISNCRLAYNEVTAGLEEKDFPKKVVMGIAGELIHGVSIVVNYDREERSSTEISTREQRDIYNQVKESVLESAKSELAIKYGFDPEDIEILHITITGVEVGGMPVEKLAGYTGKQVRLHFYASFGPKTYLDALRKVAEGMNLELIAIVSQPFAMARVFSGSSDKSFNGIFIDVGGGTTDVAVVQGGNVIDTQIFAFGGRVFTKRIAREMNLDYRHAESRKLKYSAGELDDKIANKVKKLLQKDLKVWVEGLRTSLEGMEDIESYPPFIYLCGGGSMLPDLKSTMMEYPWTQHINFMRFPKVLVVTPDKLDMVFDRHDQLKDSMDITPAGLARFAWDRLRYPDNHLSS